MDIVSTFLLNSSLSIYRLLYHTFLTREVSSWKGTKKVLTDQMQRMSMESQQQTSGLPEAAVISTGLAQRSSQSAGQLLDSWEGAVSFP